MTASYAVVIPTIGRPQLGALLTSLAGTLGACPEVEAPAEVVIVDDRPFPHGPGVAPGTANPPLDVSGIDNVRVVRTGGRGPAAARNAGWRSTSDVEWVAFLDDDVVLPPGWAQALADDLAAAEPDVAAVQGRIVVPLPRHRRPTDWERSTAGLEG